MRVRSLGREGPQEEGMATHSLYMAISACRKIFGTKQKFYMLGSPQQPGPWWLAQGGAPSDYKPKGEQEEAAFSKR